MTCRTALAPARHDRAGGGLPRVQAAGPAVAAGAEATSAGLLALFFVAVLLPINFSIGGLALTPARAFLLVAFVPLAIRWVRGAAGRATGADVFFALHCLWLGAALLAIHGSERIPYAGITVVEVFGSYLAGRMLIRNIADYRLIFRYMLIAFAVLLPFVVVEMQTGRLPLSSLLPVETYPKVQSAADQMRMGLYRAQAVFEHPILWGVFCSLAIANVFYLNRTRFFKGVALAGFATGMTSTSLSSGPLLAAVLQIGIVGWGWITRNAWWVLVGLAVLGYVVVDLLSNRSPVQVMITYLTFNSHSAYWRLHIWNFGIQNVWWNPLFGLGLNDWVRPSWMGTASVDNFWLLTTMRYGIPAFLLLVAGIVMNLVAIIRQDLPTEPLRDLRRGYVTATIALSLALCTVHAWGSLLVMVMFYFGAGAWMFTGGATPEATGEAEPADGLARARAGRTARGGRDPDPGPEPAAAAAPSFPRRGPSKAERLARRQAQYSRQRP
jgi:hypothetical protein